MQLETSFKMMIPYLRLVSCIVHESFSKNKSRIVLEVCGVWRRKDMRLAERLRDWGRFALRT
jgi:hypothetical protein